MKRKILCGALASILFFSGAAASRAEVFGPPMPGALSAGQASPGIDISQYPAGSILDAGEIGDYNNCFQIYEIYVDDDVYNRIIGQSYVENENIGLSDLRYLKMLHYNFDHQIQVGEMICNAAIAEDVINVFREFYEMEYEIYSMYLIDNFWTGDGGSSDTASIDVNNTSCFCYRAVTGGGNLSNHAYGRAIDINPQQNPYVNDGYCSHENAQQYIERYGQDPHMVMPGDTWYNTFAKYGFSWGGDWDNPKDYQHFEKK